MEPGTPQSTELNALYEEVRGNWHYREQVGDELRQLRRGLNFSIPKFARLVGVRPMAVVRWEMGTRIPRLRHFLKVGDIRDLYSRHPATTSH